MSPLNYPTLAVRRYLLAAVFCGALAALVYPWSQNPYSGGLSFLAPCFGSVVCLAGMTGCLGVAIAGAIQAMSLLPYSNRPKELLDRLKADLDSPRRWKRRLALQVLADHYGQPFGVISCWPGWHYSASQLRNMILLYKEWLQVSKEFSGDKRFALHILRRMRTPAKVAMWRELGGGRPGRGLHNMRDWTFPKVPAEELIETMRGRVEEAWRQMAEVINQARPESLMATESHIRDIIADLMWDALESALNVGLDAASAARARSTPPVRKAPTLPPHAVAAALDRANEAVKDAILDVGIPDDGPAPDPARRPLPPVQPAQLATALRDKIDQTLAALAERVNIARDLEGVAASEAEIRDLFEGLAIHALELAAGMRVDAAAEKLPWAAGQGEWAKKLRRMTVLESLPDAEPEPALRPSRPDSAR